MPVRTLCDWWRSAGTGCSLQQPDGGAGTQHGLVCLQEGVLTCRQWVRWDASVHAAAGHPCLAAHAWRPLHSSPCPPAYSPTHHYSGANGRQGGQHGPQVHAPLVLLPGEAPPCFAAALAGFEPSQIRVPLPLLPAQNCRQRLCCFTGGCGCGLCRGCDVCCGPTHSLAAYIAWPAVPSHACLMHSPHPQCRDCRACFALPCPQPCCHGNSKLLPCPALPTAVLRLLRPTLRPGADAEEASGAVSGSLPFRNSADAVHGGMKHVQRAAAALLHWWAAACLQRYSMC